MKTHSAVAGLIAAVCAFSWSATTQADAVTEWNAVTLSCVQGPPAPANRGGPGGLLDIAVVHAAVHDAVQAIQGRFEAYQYENPALRGKGSPAAAAAAAAYNVLRALYGANAPCLANVTDPATTYAGDDGLQAGLEAAAVVAASSPTHHRAADGSIPGIRGDRAMAADDARHQRRGYLCRRHRAVRDAFALAVSSAAAPKARQSYYARDYNEVKAVGGSASV